MMQLTRLMAYLVSSYGLRVIDDKDGRPVLYWALYTQGSGVTFSAEIERYEPIIKRMHHEGDLDKAAKVKALLDAGTVSFKVSYDGSRYTHTETMDVEVMGPSDEIDAETLEAIECFTSAVAEQKNNASKDAENLLSELFLLSPSEEETHRSYRTKRYLIQLLRRPVHSEDMDHLICLGDDDEDLDDLRRYTKVYQEYRAFMPVVRISLAGSAHHDQIMLAEYEGDAVISLNKPAVISGYFKECMSQASEMARAVLANVGSNFKEAA